MRAWLPTVLLASAVSAVAADRLPLTGKVTDSSGKPLEHATAMVYAAAVKVGSSIFCPTCYPDCGKRAFTDAAGAFTIPNLDPNLRFELLAIHDGYTPAFVSKVDPAQGPAKTAALAPRAPVEDPARVARGRVVDGHGLPVRDAVVEPWGVCAQGGCLYIPPIEGLEPMAVTNQKGEFELANAAPAMGMVVLVKPRGMAQKMVAMLTGAERQTIAVGDGAIVRGRLMDRGKPVAGAQVGIFPQTPGGFGGKLEISGDPYKEIAIGTKEDGSFLIPNVPAGVKWYVYGKMASIAERGATGSREVATAADGSEADVGDFEIQPGLRLRGVVTLSDGATIRAGSRAYLAGNPRCDSQEAALGRDGRFEFAGLAPGQYLVWAAVRGYALPGGEFDLKVNVEAGMSDLAIKLERRR
ncbi:MAG TPA: hypothetical protein VKF41_03390 [Bryobacteraceae bacterium]|nr:hypothetical protein [Bryobacteraceae bacterium]